MADSTNSQQVTEAVEEAPPRAVLFELETVGLAGRRAAFTTMQNILAEKHVELNVGLFAKNCIPFPPALSIPAILADVGNKRLSADKLVVSFAEKFIASLLSSDCAVNNAVVKLVAEAKARDVAIGAISTLNEEQAGMVAERVGIREDLQSLLANSMEDRNYPSADSWLKLARDLSVPPGQCVAVVTSAGSCRAALSAGMDCVAVPDQHTAFQDFGGASHVADSLDNDLISDIFKLFDVA